MSEDNVVKSPATDAEPGSEEKIRVMAARFAAEEPLFNPEDVTRLSRKARETPGTRVVNGEEIRKRQCPSSI